MNAALIISVVAAMAAFTQHASAQTSTFNQGLSDGYNGSSVAPAYGSSYTYTNGFLAGRAEAEDLDNMANRSGADPSAGIRAWQSLSGSDDR